MGIVPVFRRGEVVTDANGVQCVVQAQVHDKVWTYCRPEALDASSLRGTDAGMREQFPREARVRGL
ncbi:MAG: hypothetical protein EPO41_04035 [Reyranella sp.]|uniref:hypothetical protein n=1 Tax=Reyranella sp. TaxID=1929291 RepID=UPI001217E75C|nr:hypothetical protein [Reyranella sp.]TAJ97171.1 MAG: hypothetical protein EPO41_04035 [Reyranella sp.]